MKLKILLVLLTLAVTHLFAQKTTNKHPTEISQAEFDKHLPAANLIIKQALPAKLKGVIRFKTTKRTIVLKDDGEMQRYVYEGNLKGTHLALIHELEPNTEEYYFIDQQTGTIDTLLGKPVFHANKRDIICLEGAGTDIKQRIQVGKIKNGRFVIGAYFTIADNVSPNYVYWFDERTIFINSNNEKFYKMTF